MQEYMKGAVVQDDDGNALFRVQVMRVTPEMARDWLDNARLVWQRNISQGRVRALADDITNGNWRTTHQGIAFRRDGKLIDGQHRLSAIVRAGKPVDILVFFEIDENTMMHIDAGRARSTTDAMRVSGEHWVGNVHVAIAKVLSSGGSYAEFARRHSISEEKASVLAHKDAIDFAMNALGKTTVAGVTIAPVYAAIAAAWYFEDDLLRMESFGKLLSTGEGITDDARLIAVLRDWLKDNRVAFFHPSKRLEIYFRTQRALQAYMRKEKRVRVGTPEELPYPV